MHTYTTGGGTAKHSVQVLGLVKDIHALQKLPLRLLQV